MTGRGGQVPLPTRDMPGDRQSTGAAFCGPAEVSNDDLTRHRSARLSEPVARRARGPRAQVPQMSGHAVGECPAESIPRHPLTVSDVAVSVTGTGAGRGSGSTWVAVAPCEKSIGVTRDAPPAVGANVDGCLEASVSGGSTLSNGWASRSTAGLVSHLRPVVHDAVTCRSAARRSPSRPSRDSPNTCLT